MAVYGRKRKMSGYVKLFMTLMLLAGLGYGYYKIEEFRNRINDDKILAQSVLKDKKFAATVQEINVGKISAYLLEEHSNPIISISFVFKNAGTAYEPEQQQGLANILADMLLQGTRNYSNENFKDTSEEYGVKIGYDAGKDSFGGSLSYPKANEKTAINLFRETLYAPAFREKYLELSKMQLLKALQMANERPERVLSNKFAEFMFGGHPYSRPGIGRAQDIETLTADDLRQYMQTHFAQDNLIVGIAGDINAEETKNLLNNLFGKLPQISETKALKPLDVVTSGDSQHIERNMPQTIVHFAAKGTYRDSLDFYPLYMANYIFGEAGLNSRLNKVIREKEGLTYGIYTGLSISDASALIVGSYSATTENYAKVQDLLFEQWRKMAAEGVSEKELQQAKDAQLASYNLRFASIENIADMLVMMQKFELGIDFLDKRNDYIRGVTLREVNAAAKKYFSDLPDFVSIGKQIKENK